jgi:hypothetical protein
MNHAPDPALTGAVAGLVLGLAEYVIVLRVMARTMAHAGTEAMSGEGAAAARLGALKIALLACSFLVLPGIGYLAGSAFGH